MQSKEKEIHCACVEWFNAKYENTGAVLHHSPNENPKGSPGTLINYNAQMTKHGRKPGFPDIIIFYRHRCILIEIKTDVGVLSKAQKDLFVKLEDNGFEPILVRSVDDFIAIVEDFFQVTDGLASRRFKC